MPERVIDTLPSLYGGDPLQLYDCFISHSVLDIDFVRRLHGDLQNKGIRCWLAEENMKIGDKFRSAIDESIRISDKLLLVLSKNSIESVWVEKEVEAAFEKEQKQKKIILFPIKLDDAVMHTNKSWAADIRRTRHIGDFGNWKNRNSYKKCFERLLKDLRNSSNAL